MVVKINNKVWQYSYCEYMKYMQNCIHIILHRENIKYINDKCKQLLMYFSIPPSLLGTRKSSLAWSHNHIFLPIGQEYGDLTMLFFLMSCLLETIMKTEVIGLTVFHLLEKIKHLSRSVFFPTTAGQWPGPSTPFLWDLRIKGTDRTSG